MSLTYPKYPIALEEVNYKHYKGTMFLNRFMEDDIPVLFIGDEETEEVYVICNLNPSPYELKTFEFAVKDYSENEGMLDWLVNQGYLETPHKYIQMGYVKVPLCYATLKLKTFIMTHCLNVR